MASNDPPAALLTPRQRKVLRKETDISDRGKRAARARMRERLRTTMMDFHLILQGLDPQSIQSALERRAAPSIGEGPGDHSPEVREEILLENGLAAAIGVVFLAELERSPPLTAEDRIDMLTDTRRLEKRTEKGVRVALNRLGVSARSVDATVDIELGEEFDELDNRDVDELAKLSTTELLQAHQSGTIDSDRFMTAMEKKGLTRDEE